MNGGGQLRLQCVGVHAAEHKDDILRTHTVRPKTKNELHPQGFFV